MSSYVGASGRINRRGRLLAWRIARKSYLAADRDAELAKNLAEQELKNLALPPIVVEMIVVLIVKLIVEWIERKYLDPPESPAILDGDDEHDD